MSLALVSGGLADLDAIVAVSGRAFDPRYGEAWSAAQLRGTLGQPGSWLRIVRTDGGAGGFALCRTIVDEAELLLIAVLPEVRGTGVGVALMTGALDDARGRGLSEVFLEMRDGNAAAHALYRRCGFVEVGRRRDYYRGPGDTRYDAITMRRALHR